MNGGVSGGEVRHDPAHVVDLLPTIAQATGAELPERLAGASLLDQLRGGSAVDRDIFWEHIGNRAMRRGRYKLVSETDGEWELYDMQSDRAELHDIAQKHPQLVEDLSVAWQDWADSHGVIPWPDLVAMYVERGLPAWQATS